MIITKNPSYVVPFRVSTTYMVDIVDIFPRWDGKYWNYHNLKFRSLRLLKSSYWYKTEKLLIASLSKQIEREKNIASILSLGARICPLCNSGILEDKSDLNEVEYNGVKSFVDVVSSVCSECGVEQVDAEQSRINVEKMKRFKENIESNNAGLV